MKKLALYPLFALLLIVPVSIAGTDSIENQDRINAVCDTEIVTLYWEKRYKSESSYDVLRNGFTITEKLPAAGKSHYIDTGLVPGTKYVYTIVARNKEGSILREFDITARTATKKPPAPPKVKGINK